MAWVYKATAAKVPFHDTRRLAQRDGFLCRPAYAPNGSRPSHVHQVAVGDVLHLYYSDTKYGIRVVGSFEIVEPSRHPTPDRFGACVPGTALYAAVDPTLIALLEQVGYQPDPVVRKYVGWLLLPSNVATPPYNPALFPGQSTLHPLP